MTRTAIVLFNLGGPDERAAVRPFLFNLFRDPAIISLPQPFRWLLAMWISRARATEAGKIYAHLGGGSPLLEQTEAQARALEAALADWGETRAFIAMRYWHPMTEAAVAQVKTFAPDQVMLLPLYPQFSTTTTASSVKAWRNAARMAGLEATTRSLCCYPVQEGFIAALAAAISPLLQKADDGGRYRLLLSAHGLPKRTVAAGDPYQWQIERTAEAVVRALARPNLDWVMCYQSRVGRLEWIGPYTEDEIARAGAEGVSLVVAPIAFVSEHAETLVELDITYRDLARRSGVPAYDRVETVQTKAAFIDGLANMVRQAFETTDAPGPRCPREFSRCALARRH